MYMRGRFSYIAGEWIILKPIYHAGQIISAYETVMGLPAAERLTGSDGTFKPEADQQRIDEVHKKALAAAELPMDWDGLTDRMRDCLMAKELDADFLIILTAVEKAAINYGKPDEKWLSDITVAEAKQYIDEGHFAPGSMLPKVQAAVEFAESKPGRQALITLLEKAKDGILGKTGTRIHL